MRQQFAKDGIDCGIMGAEWTFVEALDQLECTEVMAARMKSDNILDLRLIATL